MKFDKINFILNILSSDTIISSKKNLLKLFITDSIADTEIFEVQYRLVEKDGRNTSTIIQDWTELSKTGTFYEDSYTPTFTKNCQIQLQINVKDMDLNEYRLESNLNGVL